MFFCYVAVKTGTAQMPDNSSWLSLYGVSVLTGIGFTMSLFVGNLAFVENIQYIDGVKDWCFGWIIIINFIWIFYIAIYLKKVTYVL